MLKAEAISDRVGWNYAGTAQGLSMSHSCRFKTVVEVKDKRINTHNRKLANDVDLLERSKESLHRLSEHARSVV